MQTHKGYYQYVSKTLNRMWLGFSNPIRAQIPIPPLYLQIPPCPPFGKGGTQREHLRSTDCRKPAGQPLDQTPEFQSYYGCDFICH